MRSWHNPVRNLVDAYYVGVLIFSTSAFTSLFVDLQSGDAAAGSPVLKLIWGMIYAISIMRLLPRRKDVAELLQTNVVLCSLLALALLSTLWSIAPSVSLHLSVTLLFTTLTAIDFSLTYSMKRQAQLVGAALLLCMVGSVFAEVVTPGLIPGRDLEGEAWHGLYGFKNDFGRLACLAAIVWLALARKSVWQWTGILVCGTAFCLLSRSASSVGYELLLASVLGGLSVLKWRPVQRLAALLLIGASVTLSGAYVATHFAKVTGMMDKDPHMTGRVDLWQYSIEDIRQRPVLGYGYTAFWNADSRPARLIREAVRWDDAPHAHNGYIDLALSLGLVGLVLYFVLYFTTLRRAYRFFMQSEDMDRRWPLAYLAFVLLYQCTESGIVGGNSIIWVIFASITLSLSFVDQQALPEVSSKPVLSAA